MDESVRDNLLDQLSEEFVERFRRGERPSLKDYASRYPDLAEEIFELFPTLIQVEKVDEILCDQVSARSSVPTLSQVGDYRVIREIGRGGMGTVYEAEQISLGRRVALKVLPTHSSRDGTMLERFRREARTSARLHHTNIVPVFEVGEDCDVRYYAMQFIRGQSLDAVIDELRKLRSGETPLIEQITDEVAVRRSGPVTGFAVALSLLSGRLGPPDSRLGSGASRTEGSHPRDRASTSRLFVEGSAVLPGGTQFSTAESRRHAFYRAVADIGRQVASALAYAHARGITHRDIKPSNLLLDTEGVVWVSDFGLAKADDDANLTRTGDVLGTFRYMAPERFRGGGDARGDLYSLGLTLYELLLLQPAFDAQDRAALARQIQDDEPTRPRALEPRIPRDLETIVLKAIEKAPAHRYATADELCEDLRRFLDDETILARRIGATERSYRWIRRNPVIATLGSLLILVLLGTTIAATAVARRMSRLAGENERASGRMAALAEESRNAASNEHRARLSAQAALERAERDREVAEQNVYVARIGQAEAALRLGSPGTARGLLDACRPEAGGKDRRGWEWSYLDFCCTPQLRVISLINPETSREHSTHTLALSPDGELLAVGTADQLASRVGEGDKVSTYLVGRVDGKVRKELRGHRTLVEGVAFRPDGHRLATMGHDGRVLVWETDTGRALLAMQLGGNARAAGRQRGLIWSRDGRRLLTITKEGLAQVWDPETGRETDWIPEKIHCLAFNLDGTRLAMGGPSGLQVRHWSNVECRPGATVFSRAGTTSLVAWSPDGRRLASVGQVEPIAEGISAIVSTDATDGRTLYKLPRPGEISSIAFSPDGGRLALAGNGGAIWVLDALNGHERSSILTEEPIVSDLTFGGHGRRLYVTGWSLGGVRVYDPEREPRGKGLRTPFGQASALSFAFSGSGLICADWLSNSLSSVTESTGVVRVEHLLPFTRQSFWPRNDFSLSPDARKLAAPTQRTPARLGIWDTLLGREMAGLDLPGHRVTAVAFHADNRVVAAAAHGGPGERPIVKVWDSTSERVLRTIEPQAKGAFHALALSDDGRRLAACLMPPKDGDHGARVSVWDVGTGAELMSREFAGPLQSLRFHPEGDVLAVALFSTNQVALWNLKTGEVAETPCPRNPYGMVFTPDAARLAVVGYEGNVQIHEARTGTAVILLRGLGPPVGNLGFTPLLAVSPDGARIAAYNTAGSTINIWDAGPRHSLLRIPGAGDVAGWLRRARALFDRGDFADARIAHEHALAADRGDPAPWVEHALGCWDQGEEHAAAEALSRALRGLPRDPRRWIELGRLLERAGHASQAAETLARALDLAQKQLAENPADEQAAAIVAEILPRASLSRGWHPLKPVTVSAASGAKLEVLPDSSIRVGGKTVTSDVYTIEAEAGIDRVTALRVESLEPSDRVPGEPSGGRDGRFVLGEIRLSHTAEAQSSLFEPARWTGALADIDDQVMGGPGVAAAIDGDPATGWTVVPLSGPVHRADFSIGTPIASGSATRIRVVLGFPESVNNQSLGGFRLWTTGRSVPLFEPALAVIRDDPRRSALTRLGAAYLSLGDWPRAAAVLERVASRPDAPALDGFLLALALHHQGRTDEARATCELALREYHDGATGGAVTREVALEALARLRNFDMNTAESALLDAAFPVDPFGR
ncbi:MAG: protein kinase domain-containing protein [Isosphaeraceae bacterium]